MKRDIATLGDILGIKLKLPAIPVSVPEERIVAPIPKPPKVVGDPTRVPVNKQAAMLLSRAEPQPLPPESPKQAELPRLREENTKLRAANANLVDENSALRRRVQRMEMLLSKKSRKMATGEQPPVIPHNMADNKKEQLLERLTHDV